VYFISNGGQTFSSFGISASFHTGDMLKLRMKTNDRWWAADCVVSRNTWPHIAMSWNIDAGLNAYQDAVECDKDLVGSINTRATTTYNGFYFGRSNKVAGTGAKGKLDEILFWSKMLLTEDVLEVYETYHQNQGTLTKMLLTLIMKLDLFTLDQIVRFLFLGLIQERYLHYMKT